MFYTPGIISLIGFLIALPSFYKKNITAKEYVLPLFALADSNKSYLTSPLKSDWEKHIEKKRKLIFEFDQNKIENYKKLNLIRYEVLKLKYTKDTSTIVLVNLSDSISFGEFVSLIDMCEADKHNRYASWDNKFAILGEWPKKEIKTVDTLPLLMCGYIPMKKIEKKPSFIQKAIKKIKNNYTQQGLYLLIGFLLLIISFLRSRKMTN